MLELDESHKTIIESLRDGLPAGEVIKNKEFVSLLEEHGFLARPEDERLKLMGLRYKRNATCFSTDYIGLTICPTLACNFTCAYCFEHSQADTTVMDEKTMEGLIAFIKKHNSAKHMSVNWYGGEPTLAYHVIEALTEKFIKLFPNYANAGMVTNGYLLNQQKIDRLNELKITTIQITLDGSEKTHNKRRTLRNGEETYEKILRNIDLLMDSSWKGKCYVRINVDKNNLNEYAALRNELLDRYKGRDLSVYPGHVNTFERHEYDQQLSLCNSDWNLFKFDLYTKEGILPHGGFYPCSFSQNTCIATSHQGFVVGPKGELYKCWEDVGKKDMVIGSVHKRPFLTNPELLARYTIGTDPHSDMSCIECKIFPICGGGCVKMRMQKQQFGVGNIEYCSPLKDSLERQLDLYMDSWHSNQIRNAVLGKEIAPSMENGYRMVQPREKKGGGNAINPLENLVEQI